MRANKAQQEAISQINGPVCIIAGPGTGKTWTLVHRIVHMVRDEGINENSIMVVTFTKKAAKELLLRVQNALREAGITVNVHEMYIGTIHDICLRILEEFRDKTYLENNFRVVEESMFNTLIYDAYTEAEKADGRTTIKEEADQLELIKKFEFKPVAITSRWERSKKIAEAFSKINEELISGEELLASSDEEAQLYGQLKLKIEKILREQNTLDFSTMQTECYRLISQNPDVLATLRERIHYIMVDEYQDTNYVQEKILMLLAGEEKNICVVGDDDQSLYRFRGATVRNLLQFKENEAFKGIPVKEIKLETNYRSDPSIVKCYNSWMSDPTPYSFSWETDRLPKTIVPNKPESSNRVTALFVSPDVMEEDKRKHNLSKDGDKTKLLDWGDHKEKLTAWWANKHVELIKKLKAAGTITDYNQIAFLSFSLNHQDVEKLMEALEKNNIPVYAPRSKKFFARDEVKLFIGALCGLFYNEEQINNLEYINSEYKSYLTKCNRFLQKYQGENGSKLREFVSKKYTEHQNLEENADYGFTELGYMILAQKAFSKYLAVNPGAGVVNERPARNLANILNAISTFEEYYGVEVLTPKWYKKYASRLITIYLAHLYTDGVDEYEDEIEYAPSGCVSFLTIHQSKGMEFPIVIVGSLNRTPSHEERFLETKSDRKLQEIINDNLKHPIGESIENIKYYDFYRLFYVAFSRAKNLLILSIKDNEYSDSQYRTFSPAFMDLLKNIGMLNYKNSDVDIEGILPENVTTTDLMQTYSFTSKIAVYETCPKQYKYFKEYGFPEIGNAAMLFGTLVHQTVEDIHKAAIDGRMSDINPDSIRNWAENNYRTLSATTRGHLGKGQIESAIRQILKYVDWRAGAWDVIKETEVEVSHVEDNYILVGNVDLVEGKDGKLELVDFKTQSVVELRENPEWLGKYRQQLAMYAHLIQEKYKKKVERASIYCTKDDNEADPKIVFELENTQVDQTIKRFKEIVKKIQSHDYSGSPKDKKTCDNCVAKLMCEERRR